MFIALVFLASMQIISGDISVDSSEYSAQQRFTNRMKGATVIKFKPTEDNKALVGESNLRGGALAEFNWVEKEVGGKTTQNHDSYVELTIFEEDSAAACHSGKGKRWTQYFRAARCLQTEDSSIVFYEGWMYAWGNAECKGEPESSLHLEFDETVTCDLFSVRTVSSYFDPDIIKRNKRYGEVTLQWLQFRNPWAAENFDRDGENFSFGIAHIEEINKCSNVWGGEEQSEILRCINEDTVEYSAFSGKDCFGKKVGSGKWKLKPEMYDGNIFLPRCVKFDDTWVEDYM